MTLLTTTHSAASLNDVLSELFFAEEARYAEQDTDAAATTTVSPAPARTRAMTPALAHPAPQIPHIPAPTPAPEPEPTPNPTPAPAPAPSRVTDFAETVHVPAALAGLVAPAGRSAAPASRIRYRHPAYRPGTPVLHRGQIWRVHGHVGGRTREVWLRRHDRTDHLRADVLDLMPVIDTALTRALDDPEALADFLGCAEYAEHCDTAVTKLPAGSRRHVRGHERYSTPLSVCALQRAIYFMDDIDVDTVRPLHRLYADAVAAGDHTGAEAYRRSALIYALAVALRDYTCA